MTDTTELAPPTGRTGLAAMNVAELKGLAAGLGITGTTRMRKGDLVAAIRSRQSGGATGLPSFVPERAAAAAEGPSSATSPTAAAQAATESQEPAARHADEPATRHTDEPAARHTDEPGARHTDEPAARHTDEPGGERTSLREPEEGRGVQQPREGWQRRDQSRPQRTQRSPDAGGGQGAGPDPLTAPSGSSDEEDGRGGRRRNRQRSRDRKRGRGPVGGAQDVEPELQVHDDDVLLPVAGILDVLETYAFVRTSGYLAGPNDVYVSLGMVKRYGLRKGDAVTGAVKAPREGEQGHAGGVGRQRYNALVRLDTINGMTPEQSRARAEFGKLTPLYPQERLRLETEPHVLTTRIIDLVAPIGKGQRGLIVAPSKAGKTMVMQALANAITANNPECHLMVVLVDERPEEVTDMQRAVKGEVISSTFDRPAEDHTTVAELSIERAKRLVEMGHDVVVLLDSITKLGRAYNLAAPASGRILSGGVDSAALYPPKKFFGAARNIENGGSLTILATALVETGSRMDEVIFEEFKGTGNMELRLSRELANRRIFPAVDVNNSSTRREEILLGAEELKIMWKLRRVLAALDSQQGIELLLDRLKKTRSNVEFLRQVQLTSSARLDAEDA